MCISLFVCEDFHTYTGLFQIWQGHMPEWWKLFELESKKTWNYLKNNHKHTETILNNNKKTKKLFQKCLNKQWNYS